MKKSRFTEEQIVKMLREADRTTVAAVSKANGVSEQSLYNWRKQYAGMAVDEVRRLRQLEQENARLKKVLAERVLEIERRLINIGFSATPARRSLTRRSTPPVFAQPC